MRCSECRCLGKGAEAALYVEELAVFRQKSALLWLQAWSEPGVQLWYSNLMGCHVPAALWEPSVCALHP